MNILINAYAVSPSWGSEQGMGWNWVINIAKFCNVFVITEGEYQNSIEEALEILPQKDNIHFYYNPLSDTIRKMCWNQGDWRFYYYYRKWQIKTLKIAKEISKENHIDVIHQLNMVGFREPGFLWKIKGIPYIWGPICGMEQIPMPFIKESPFKFKAKIYIKNLITRYQINHSHRVRQAIRHCSYIIAATKQTCSVIEKFKSKDSVIFINETGLTYFPEDRYERDFNSETLNILWAGRFLNTKKLDLALETIRNISNLNIHLQIAGTGSPKEIEFYKSYADKLGISDRVTWLGKVQHEKMNELMANADLFLFTSISEATSTVVPEAISCNLPILCFNICGFGPLVKDKVGETIELSNPKKAAKEFADKLSFLYCHREKLKEYSLACDKYKQELSWEWKAKKMVEIYDNAIINIRNAHVLQH